MNKNELIEWAHGQTKCAAVIHKSEWGDILPYNVQLWHWVESVGFVYAGFGYMCGKFVEAFELARECATETVQTDFLPDGWHYVEGATTAPNGYKWAGRGSRFRRVTGGEPYRHVLVMTEG